jgi:2'-5' RNA ligase
MIRKLFVGIPLDGSTHTVIDRNLRAWEELPISWTKRENRHITLFFLGLLDDEYLIDIEENLRNACYEFSMFDILFTKISVGPEIAKPKMVWLTGEMSQQLIDLHHTIRRAIPSFAKDEKKQFSPHITLGRIRKSRFVGKEEVLTQIHKEIRIPVSVETVVLFESIREKKERIYVPLDTFSLHE